MSDALLGPLIGATLLLGIERACYVWIAHGPDSFRRWCERPAIAPLGEPVAIVRLLFLAFKVLQGAVFLGWYLRVSGLTLPPWQPVPWVVGLATAAAGQILSGLVFYRLGRVGIFFGDRLGYPVRWCRAFPFSVLAHPQYVGAVMTIWGLFLVARFPHPDWVLLALIETALYAAGGYLEGAAERREVRTG